MTEEPMQDLPPFKGGWIQDVAVALVFLTRLPIRPGFTFGMGALRTACRAFPLVGLIVGGLSGTLYVLATMLGLPSLVAALIAIAAQVMLTGALHEDAIADVADGFGGGTDRDSKLTIMRDSHVGTYAVVILILVIGIKAAAISEIEDPLMVFALLVAASSISRGLMGWALYLLPPARDDGLGRGAGQPEIMAVLGATLLTVLIAILILGASIGAIALLAAIVGAALIGAVAYRQIGGQTGDVLGAIQQVSELFILLACVAIIG